MSPYTRSMEDRTMSESETGYAEFHTGRGNSCESGIGAENGCYRCQQFDGAEAALIADDFAPAQRPAREDKATGPAHEPTSASIIERRDDGDYRVTSYCCKGHRDAARKA